MPIGYHYTTDWHYERIALEGLKTYDIPRHFNSYIKEVCPRKVICLFKSPMLSYQELVGEMIFVLTNHWDKKPVYVVELLVKYYESNLCLPFRKDNPEPLVIKHSGSLQGNINKYYYHKDLEIVLLKDKIPARRVTVNRYLCPQILYDKQ